jgi:hypothetical protein
MSLDIYLLKHKVKNDAEDYNSDDELYWANITHNLGEMAHVAGFYRALWRPEEMGITTAKELTPYIKKGIIQLIKHPETFKVYDSPNGWGTYDNFLPWLTKLLVELYKYPEAYVYASR